MRLSFLSIFDAKIESLYDDYDDGGQHSGQQGHAEPASKISSVSSAAACIPTPCFQTHKTAGLSSTAESSAL